MGKPQLQEKQQVNISAEIGKSYAKKALLHYLKLPLIIGVGVFLLILICAGLILTFTLQQPEQETSAGGWEIGGITEFGANEIPASYIPIYKEAGEKYGVPWNLLAAHHRVETRFSTISPMISPVGAIGHMQFMPLTWVGWGYPGGTRLGDASIPDSELTSPIVIKKYDGYGTDGDGDGRADPMNLTDAVHSAAKYLAANGAASGNLRKAVFAYNHSEKYVNDVLGFADLYVSGYKAISGGTTAEIIDGAAWPVPGIMQVTSVFGNRTDPVYGGTRFHGGIDIAGPGANGKPIVSMLTGKVTFAGVRGGYGNCVIIDHGNGLSSLYGHMSSIKASTGQQVKAGQMIGTLGSTGKSTGPHLHFTVKVNGESVDPEKYLTAFKYTIR
jgi:murein DD-endopeptidase MepM/ murein hydrolase activator NlpD